MAVVTMNTEAAVIVTSNFCFKGRWDCSDTTNMPPGGQVVYIDAFGIQQTRTGICGNEVVTINAQSIVSSVGVDTVDCGVIGDNLLFKLINPLNRPASGHIIKNNYEGGPYLTINTSGMLNGILNTGDTFSAVFKNNSTTQIRQVRYLYESSIRGILYDRVININVNVSVTTVPFAKIDGETITITLEVLN